MILGVYWYFGFPEGLYAYDYFKWKPGYGGHADNPASLEATVSVADPDQMIDQLRQLIKKFNEGFIFIYRKGGHLKIGTGSWHLFDYDFQLMLEVENMLKLANAVVVPDDGFKDAELVQVQQESLPVMSYPKKKVLKMVGSSLKKSNAETSSLRMDCFLLKSHKDAFLIDLDQISEEEKIEVLYYLEKDYQDGVNLMVFFSNGRQWLNEKGKRTIDVTSLENKIEALQGKLQVVFKHEGGWDDYPKGNPKVIKMVDEDLIL